MHVHRVVHSAAVSAGRGRQQRGTLQGMSTSACVIRDFHLSDLPPLAYADDLETAKATVELLQGEFFDQLDANGEGCNGARQTLAVTSCCDGQVHYVSGAYGSGRGPRSPLPAVWSAAGGAVDQLAQDVCVSGVAAGLLDHVCQGPPH